jgi:hypothetical protein
VANYVDIVESPDSLETLPSALQPGTTEDTVWDSWTDLPTSAAKNSEEVETWK